MAAYERQVRQAQHLEDLQRLADKLQQMVTVHQQYFPPIQPPVAPPPDPVDFAQIQKRHRREALAGISLFKRRARREAKGRATESAQKEISEEQVRRQQFRDQAQRALDDSWKKLLDNEPETVLATLEEAFADNAAPATPVDCQDGRVTTILLIDGPDAVPERIPHVTPTGKPSSRKLSKTDRNELHLAWVSSNVLATMREAFTVAPSIHSVTMVVLRRDSMTPFGERPLSAVYAGTLSREQADRIVWDRPEALDAIFHAKDLLVRTKGRTKELVPIDLAPYPDLAELVQQVRQTLSQETLDSAASSFDVILVDPGSRKIEVIKELHELTGLGISEAKSLVDRVPSIVLYGVDRQLANLAEKKLTAVSDDVQIRISPSSGNA